MPDPHLIGPVPATSARTPAPGRRRRPLPPDLLRDASRRLQIMSLVACGLWILGSALGHLALRSMSPGDPEWRRLTAGDGIAASSVLVSLLLFVYTRRGDRDPRNILNLGLAYMVFTAFALGLTFHWAPTPTTHDLSPQISWIGAVVLMSAAIVPSTPARTMAAGVLAVSMNPIAMLIARARGLWNFHSPADALFMHFPDYLLLGVAVVISHVVTGLGQQVAKAREMGSYQLGELLGRGGMGEVYRATHRMLARPAAIKLIRPEMLGGSDPAAAQLAVTRFRREAQTAANLRSPHTVELFDFGITDDQTLYFVMELLEGLNLESLVRRHGVLPAGRVVHILRQVCASLEEAHVGGLVHRDIKPANIHVGRVGLVYDFVKVLDFGLVKPIKDATLEHSLVTQGGLVIGTPGYMAPETALRPVVDGRADLYSVGCVAYYLLTGRQVFEGDTMMQVFAQHLQAEPTPPSQRGASVVPPDLEQLVLNCLAKKPEDRPQGAAELDRRLAEIDVERWTDVHARQWWAQAQPSPSGPDGSVETHTQIRASAVTEPGPSAGARAASARTPLRDR
ncbi:MAG TPA: serine/threonine-protein kinase [Vicinamibacterales bacterium]|nr:serine/threonine-protein kinase [Vicinamibacterales bacterium]